MRAGLTSWRAVACRRSRSGSSTRGNQSRRQEREGSGKVGSSDGHKLGNSLNRGGAKIGTSDLRIYQVRKGEWNARGFYEGFVALLRVVKIHPLQTPF